MHAGSRWPDRLKVRVASIGKDRSGLFQPGVDEYSKRLLHYTRFELLELPEATGKRLPPDVAKEKEAASLLAKKGPQDWIIAMDERGKNLSSVEFAQFVAKAQQQAKDLLFVIGGDEGLSPSLVKSAQLTLSLSRMTLPHRLARLVLVEQIYRAFTLIRGEPYHK